MTIGLQTDVPGYPTTGQMIHTIDPVATKPKRQSWIGKVLILVFSLLVCLEGGSRLVLSINRFAGGVTGIDDSTYRLRWIRLHPVHRGFTSYQQLLQMSGNEDVHHSTRGWTLRPRIQDMSVFEGKILNSNSHGLRGKTEYGYQRTPGNNGSSFWVTPLRLVRKCPMIRPIHITWKLPSQTPKS